MKEGHDLSKFAFITAIEHLQITPLLHPSWGFPVVLVIKNLPVNAEDTGDIDSIPRSGRPLEEEMKTHSSILVWEMLWTGRPGVL